MYPNMELFDAQHRTDLCPGAGMHRMSSSATSAQTYPAPQSCSGDPQARVQKDPLSPISVEPGPGAGSRAGA